MLRRLLRTGIITLVVGYIGIGVFLYIYQQKLLYHPTPNVKIDYPQMVMHREGAEVVVHVLNGEHKNAILYFGGNRESMAQRADYIAQQFPNFTCYLMDYRGYGESTGEPSQKALYADALVLYDMVIQKHERISISGRSLGTGIATYVAAHRKVSKLALITPYDSIVSVAQERYPIYPASLLLKDKYNSISWVKDIKAKTFIVMAENDRVVTKKHTLRLIKAFKKEQLEVATIKNRGHNDISDDDRYYKVMQGFIGEG
ncbi:MAG: alpha/beta hydrolase [Sulfurovum sp.]|nr:alpha/beta hydrolase [Sulfurovum sp.]